MKTNRNRTFMILIIVITFLFSSCSCDIKLANEEVPNYINTFWDGLLHGIIAVPVWIVNVFSVTKHAIYATKNNGDWYNLGFLMGVGSIVGFSYKNK